MLAKPTCLHLPPLYEEGTAHLFWEEVAVAEQYELDGHFGEDFHTALTGKTWKDLRESQKSWDEIEQGTRSWEEIEALPAQGLSWRYLEFLDHSWEEIKDKGVSWQELWFQKPRFTLYRGPGEKTPGPDQGRTWHNLFTEGKTWQEAEELALSWEDFELLPSVGLVWGQWDSREETWRQREGASRTWQQIEWQPPYGLTWSSLDGRYLGWEDIPSHTWQELEHLPADNHTHRAYKADIPLYEKSAIFRVRALAEEGASDYLTSTLTKTLPRSLKKYKPPCLHVPELHEGVAADVIWGDLYGASAFVLERKLDGEEFTLQYAGAGEPVLNRDNKKNCPILTKINDVSTHFHHVDHIPIRRKLAVYRVKACNTTDHSQYLESEPVPIIPAFYREGTLRFAAVTGESYTNNFLPC